ncbi:M48 family metallopeptidase [Chitinimonas sp. JJ19]|uniref:M48 family metallopeptidase n=1 Tax=Chitinimonas sp. JJ19 TaxID=3109352 RepID=UPI001A490053|nr:M48 family metalloprotease [Chitinimonas sp.]
MENLYPAGPASVPADLTAPTARYKRSAWLAVAGLMFFVLLYLSLSAWFVWQSWRLWMASVNTDAGLQSVVTAAASAFLAVFMLKALFFVKQGGEPDDIEVTAKDEPTLFAFLYKLADEAGAPRPHRVFLSPRVNAAVFYDLSILNLLFPSRKNLEIGLPLVNVLTLGELKAVLAHEFGHFAQRTMAVGRWVYISQQIAGHIIAKRDMLDGFLSGLSRFDIRVAWIGWILSLIVWSIRSLLESAFHLVVLAQRALSREMEMQADLVAVSLTGSDELVHALHRLGAADDAWDRAVGFAASEFDAGQRVTDLFAVQSRVIAHMRTILNEPDYCRPPAIPARQPQDHRLFTADLAQPPRMWSTHPFNHEREANAKRVYLPVPGESRSAWLLFRDAAKLREDMSVHVFRLADGKPTPIAMEEALEKLDKQFQREDLNRFYRGAYLGRSVVRHVGKPGDLYGHIGAPAQADIDALYPDSLGHELDRWRSLGKELALLEGLKQGSMTATDGEIRHRGRLLRRRELPVVIEEVKKEFELVEQLLQQHDKQCRTAHLAIARQMGQGWEAYLRGLAALIHFAEHSQADVRDAQGALGNVLAIETAGGKVDSAAAGRIVAAANRLHTIMSLQYGQRATSVLPGDAVLARMQATGWSQALGVLELPMASLENINQWLKVIDGWVNAYANVLSALRDAALGQLLSVEGQLAKQFREGLVAEPAPIAPVVPDDYPVLLPGNERPRQTKLKWWVRFQIADGPVALVARLLVAGGIIGLVLGFGGGAAQTDVTVYNGFGAPVLVNAAGRQITLESGTYELVDLPSFGDVKLEAHTLDGRLIESFEPELQATALHYVYNVAGASPMVEWTAVYGSYAEEEPRFKGAPRWFATEAEYRFSQPPASIESKGNGGRRVALAGGGNAGPYTELGMLPDDEGARKALVLQRARWEGAESIYAMHWLMLAQPYPEYAGLLSARLKEDPEEVISLRAEQDASGVHHAAVCARHKQLALAKPESPQLQYLAVRCQEKTTARDSAMIAGAKRWPELGWFSLGAAYAEGSHQRWAAAETYFLGAHKRLPAMRDSIGVELARIYRLNKQRVPDNIVESSSQLRLQQAIEAADPTLQGTLKATSLLAGGQLDAALELVRGTPSESYMVRMAAGSDGADAKLVQQALALGKDAGLSQDSAWVMLALAARERVDGSVYAAAMTDMEPQERASLLAFRDALLAGRNTAQAERLLDGLMPSLRGAAYGMGAIMLGPQAPKHWREDSKRLLMPSERPYLG